jgi:ATP-dependent protease Clp ATPase subunit
VEEALAVAVEKERIVFHQGWVNKVIQLYETTLVRHGIMLVGPTGGGKTKIFKVRDSNAQLNFKVQAQSRKPMTHLQPVVSDKCAHVRG